MNKPSTEVDRKTRNRKGFIRAFLFLVCFLLFLYFANHNLIETDLISGSTVREMQARNDIELAFVGSSVVLYHMNPEIVKQETGLTAFNCAIHSALIPGDLAMTREMYKTSHPKWIVLVLEPYALNTAKESIEAECRMAPFLTGTDTLLEYYLSASRIDHAYIDRAFIPRKMFPKSIRGILKTLHTKRDAADVIIKYADCLNPKETYMGSGYVRHAPDPESLNSDLRVLMYREDNVGNYYPLLEDTVTLLRMYRKTVEEEYGARLMIIITPEHTSHTLATPSYLPYCQSLMRFCQEESIPCFNFQYARPELMPCLDEYFFDVYHMSGEGSDLFTKTFCRVFNAVQNGEDVSGLFYGNDWQYLDSLHGITNTWLWPAGKDTFKADCNIDWHSSPEYRFVYLDADGNETLLRDYGEDPVLHTAYPGTGNLRVYARIKGEEQDPDTYFDYPADFDFARRMRTFEY